MKYFYDINQALLIHIIVSNANKYIKMENISLYLPYVFTNVDDSKIKEVLEKYYALGKINRIDYVSKLGNNNTPVNAVYVHFEYWNNTESVRKIHDRILLNPGEKTNLLYDEIKGSYWRVMKKSKTSKRVISGERKTRFSVEIEHNDNVSEIKSGDMKTNSYFSSLVNKPLQKIISQERNVYSEKKELPETIFTELDYEQMEEIETFWEEELIMLEFELDILEIESRTCLDA